MLGRFSPFAPLPSIKILWYTLWQASLLKKVVERESQFGLAVHMARRFSFGLDMLNLT